MGDLLRKIGTLVTREGPDARVVGVEVWLGALSHMSESHFREHFRRETKGTPIEGAVLSLVTSGDIHDPHAQDILLKSVSVET